MLSRTKLQVSETQKRRSLLRRMTIMHGVLLLFTLLVVARLLELQVIRGAEYRETAESQHFGGVKLPAKRGEILGVSSKTNETNIFATNTTLDLVYVDPLITEQPTIVAETLANILVIDEFHRLCSAGNEDCPRELMRFYEPAFDPISRVKTIATGGLLEPVPTQVFLGDMKGLPDITEVRRLFARDIERRISQKSVTFVPLTDAPATKVQMSTIENLHLPGISVDREYNLVYANPEQVNQYALDAIARGLGATLEIDPGKIRSRLRSRPLRYVPIMRRLPPSLSLAVKDAQLKSMQESLKRAKALGEKSSGNEFTYPLRSVAFIPEHWRFYPDDNVGSQVVGFLNVKQEAQYGIERTFNPQLRGQEGAISTVSDLHGGQILTAEQKIENPRDGDAIVLTLDRTIQKEVEKIVQAAIEKYKADSGQVIVMDPKTGRILAMVNAPLFDSNNYAIVYEKEPILIDAVHEKKVVVEVQDPRTNTRALKAYYEDVFSPEGRAKLSEKLQQNLNELEKLYDLRDLSRMYQYIGENTRREVFPTKVPHVWLKYKNDIGVGAYLNRTVQEIYEPGSVMKPITMAVAIDQGELTPTDIYDDIGPVQVDEYTIKNALLSYYGKVTMVNCLEYSINTCMTWVSAKLGPKLFERMLERFGFGRITGIELEDELPGEVKPWRVWSRSLLATASFGQGISVTPLQMITALAALANDGKLMRPTIVDRIIHSNGTIDVNTPKVVEQVITPEAAETVTAMLVSTAERGYAKAGAVPRYKIAAKTGTSQIARPGGGYESGTGATIASFFGYAPVNNPRFIILVKIDRPQYREVVHGAAAAAPVFKDIASFLFKYYGIPPDAR